MPGISVLVQQLRTLMAGRIADGQSDQHLLEEFLSQRDEASFAAMLERHGPMVLGVCRRVLHDEHLAEDAFQATFLILARKAATIRKRQSVGSWLHGVAARLARKAKMQAARSQHPEPRRKSQAVDPHADASWHEARAILDEELDRLPGKYRLPLVLCYLEGLTRDEAAVQLGWSAGELRGLLDRARQRLRSRLIRRGVTLSAAGAGALLADTVLSAAVPPLLAVATMHAAAHVAAGTALGACGVSASVVALTEGGIEMMASKAMTLILPLVLVMGVIGSGVGIVAQRTDPAAAVAALPVDAPVFAPVTDQAPERALLLAQAQTDGDWHPLKKGELLTVDVERCLYEVKGEKRFRMAVRLTNVTKGEIGVDWQEPRPRLYPNQWGVHDTNERGIIDERRTVHAAPDLDQVRADFQAGRLTRIPAGQSIIVWSAFNNSGRADVDAGQGKYLIVSMDGQFCATDGATVDTLSCEWKKGVGPKVTDVVIPFPVKWEKQPNKGTAIDLHFHPSATATDLKVELTTAAKATRPHKAIYLVVKITNRSADEILTGIAREWNGAKPPKVPGTLLYASITPVKETKAAAFEPAYQAGDGAPDSMLDPVTVATGKSAEFLLRMDWPGAGIVPARPFTDSGGSYKVQMLLVFQKTGKSPQKLQYVMSEPTTVEVPGLKPVGAKPEPWTGEPVIDGDELTGGKKLATFNRLPRAADATLLRINCYSYKPAADLTAANFPAVLDSMKAVKADDPRYKDIALAHWSYAQFETPEGRFQVEFYLGGLALLTAPDGSVGRVTFHSPKLPLPGGTAPHPELVKACKGALLATLQKVGAPELGPPGAADYASTWKVERVLRGDYPKTTDLSFRVQSLPEKSRERPPDIGKTYILITHEANAGQIAAILEADEKTLRQVQDLLKNSAERK